MENENNPGRQVRSDLFSFSRAARVRVAADASPLSILLPVGTEKDDLKCEYDIMQAIPGVFVRKTFLWQGGSSKTTSVAYGATSSKT